MKVLWKPKKSIQIKCETCGCVLEVKEEDLCRDQYLDFAVKCPTCRYDIAITDEEQSMLNYVTYNAVK